MGLDELVKRNNPRRLVPLDAAPPPAERAVSASSTVAASPSTNTAGTTIAMPNEGHGTAAASVHGATSHTTCTGRAAGASVKPSAKVAPFDAEEGQRQSGEEIAGGARNRELNHHHHYRCRRQQY